MLQKHVKGPPIMSEDSSIERQVSKKEELLNKLLNKSTIITSFSARPKDSPILEQFKQIAKREEGSRSFSQVLLKALQEYNKRHEAGNPQHKLTPYIDENAESPTRVLCHDLDGALQDGRLHCKRAGLWIQGIRCFSCKHNRLRKNK